MEACKGDVVKKIGKGIIVFRRQEVANAVVKVMVKKFWIIINLCMKRPSRRKNCLLHQIK